MRLDFINCEQRSLSCSHGNCFCGTPFELCRHWQMISDVHCRIMLFKENNIGESLKTWVKFANFISEFKILHQSSHVETCSIVFWSFFCKNQLVPWSLGSLSRFSLPEENIYLFIFNNKNLKLNNLRHNQVCSFLFFCPQFINIRGKEDLSQ